MTDTMKRYAVIILSLILVLGLSCSRRTAPIEPLQIGWEKIFGGKLYDQGTRVIQTSDGGLVITGSYGGSSGTEWSDVYLIKTDRYGNVLWEKTFGQRGTHCGESVRETSDRGLIIVGQTNPYGSHNTNVYLIKTSQSGDTIWTRSIGEDAYEMGYDVEQTDDGGYIIVGWTRETVNSALLIMKTNSKGYAQWKRVIDGVWGDWGRAIERTPDGYYIVTGTTSINGYYDMFLMKISDGGDIIWFNTYGGSFFDAGYSVCLCRDGGFGVVGCTDTDEYHLRKVYLVKVDGDGHLVWERTFGGGYSACGYCIQPTKDGGFIVCCFSEIDNMYRANIIRTDGYGNEVWTQICGEMEYDIVRSMQPIDHGGYVATGCIAGDVWLFKME